ncbi:MAG: site-specific integrase [Eubacteriales bacterium]|nr:site-specific integrase [Eubacteriales bacterium]
MEIEEYDLDLKTNKYHRSEVKVVEHTKSEAGLRKVYLSDDAKKILQMVKEFNESRKWYDDDYIFLSMRTHTRTTTKAVSSYLKDACKKAGISAKSSHKIRKSFLSWAYSEGVHLETVRKIAGHEDIRTTMKYYLFDQRKEQHTASILEQHVTPALEVLPS